MSMIFKLILVFIILLSILLCQVSGEEGVRAIIIDRDNTSTNVTNFNYDVITITKGYSDVAIPVKTIKEVNFWWKDGKQFATILTTVGKNITGWDKYRGYYTGYTEDGAFTLDQDNAQKIIFIHPQIYKFILDNCMITNTRAVHEDTDFASLSVSVDNKKIQKSPTNKYLGDLNNGLHTIDLEVGPTPIFPDPNIPVIIGFEIVNAGNNNSGSHNGEITNAVSAGAGALTDEFAPGAGTIVEVVVKSLADVLTVNCDGPVVVDRIVTNGEQLAEWTSKGPYSVTNQYPGIDSPTGCGSNSQYEATWHVERIS